MKAFATDETDAHWALAVIVSVTIGTAVIVHFEIQQFFPQSVVLSPITYTYIASYCLASPINGTSASCQISSPSSPGVFCWGSGSSGSDTNAPQWPVEEAGSGSGGHPVAYVGAAWQGTTCSMSASSEITLGVAGLSIGSNGAGIYGGESGGNSTGKLSYTFSYDTDPGTGPEAVAIMVSCGDYGCKTIEWPDGCNTEFVVQAGNREGQALALCNQTEGSSYTVVVKLNGAGGAAVADARFEDGTWGSPNSAPNSAESTISTTTSISTTINTTTTIPPANITYDASYCSVYPTSGTSVSCSVNASTQFGTLCWGSSSSFSIKKTAWPVGSRTSSFRYNDVEIGAPWLSSSTCSISVPNPTYIGVAGLSVTSNSTVDFTGQSDGSFNSGTSYTFKYSTDPGAYSEAVAIMVSCGGYACQSIYWPAGCSIVFSTPQGYYENQALALCNQTEGSSYSVTVKLLRGGAVVVSAARFAGGVWS